MLQQAAAHRARDENRARDEMVGNGRKNSLTITVSVFLVPLSSLHLVVWGATPLLGDIYYNNLSFRLSLVRYINIKFLHTKINKSS